MTALKYFSILLITICMGLVNCDSTGKKSYPYKPKDEEIFVRIENLSSKTLMFDTMAMPVGFHDPHYETKIEPETGAILSGKKPSANSKILGNFFFRYKIMETDGGFLTFKVNENELTLDVKYDYKDEGKKFSLRHKYDTETSTFIFYNYYDKEADLTEEHTHRYIPKDGKIYVYIENRSLETLKYNGMNTPFGFNNPHYETIIGPIGYGIVSATKEDEILKGSEIWSFSYIIMETNQVLLSFKVNENNSTLVVKYNYMGKGKNFKGRFRHEYNTDTSTFTFYDHGDKDVKNENEEAGSSHITKKLKTSKEAESPKSSETNLDLKL